ncbi:MAG: maleylpyruvate isomerase N-terminal domain-containing protein [Acidimicrobiia bacterium]
MSWDEVTHAFFAAAETFDRLLDAPEVIARWDEPSALSGYSVGGIVGHVTMAVGWLEPMLDTGEPSDVPVLGLGDYYASFKITGPERSPIHDVIRDLSEEAARPGPTLAAEQLQGIVERLCSRLGDERADRTLDLRPVISAAVRLEDFVRTRVLELVVHADDLAASVGLEPPEPAPGATAAVLDVLLATARTAHGDLAVIRALARRERASRDVLPVF